MAKWIYWTWLLLASFGGAAGSAKDRAAVGAVVTVRLIDQAGVPGSVLWPATERARTLFSATGVRLKWKGATGVSRQKPLQGNYGMQVRGESIDLLMRRSLSDEQKGALAFAAPFASTGVRITIFYDRVAPLLSSSAPAGANVLACVLAHEIAHVLLRTNGHSESGLMRAHWTSGDLARMARGSLSFTPDIAELIRRNVGASQINRASGLYRAARP